MLIFRDSVSLDRGVLERQAAARNAVLPARCYGK
jgi:hypothetical protein